VYVSQPQAVATIIEKAATGVALATKKGSMDLSALVTPW